MKNILLIGISFFMLTSLLSAVETAKKKQKKPVEAQYSYIVEVPDLKKDEVYKRSKLWVGESFRSAKQVIVYDDADIGTIIATPIIEVEGPFKNPIPVSFRLKLESKDGKARFTGENFELAQNDPFGDPIFKRGYGQKIEDKLESLVANYSATLNKKTEDDDW